MIGQHARATRLLLLLLLFVALVVGACSSSAAPTPAASVPPPLTTADLKYALMNRFGLPWFCDPDEFPVARNEAAQAIARWPEVERDEDALLAARRHLGIPEVKLTDAQKLAIYREWKRLTAIALDPVGSDRYRFDLRTVPPNGADEGRRTTGIVDARGGIEVDQEAPATAPPCPICLDGAALIDTPAGAVRVDSLAVGEPVWTFDRDGARVEAVVLAVRSVPVPPTHRLVRLSLDDGRILLASPGHPLLDGRALGDVRSGDLVDGSRVASAELVPAGSATWDLLPSGPTGAYVADGVPLRSTLAP